MAHYPIVEKKDRPAALAGIRQLPAFYMEDFSVLGFRVNDCDRAVRILDRHAFTLTRTEGSVEVEVQPAARLCWLNTDSTHVCHLAILGRNDYLPWRPAKVCFQHQRDFNYIEARHLWEDAQVGADGVHLAGMHYQALVLEEDPPQEALPAIETLVKAGRIIRWSEDMDEGEFVRAIDECVRPDVQVSPQAADLRVRHMRKAGLDYHLLFNEGEHDLSVHLRPSVRGSQVLLDPETLAQQVRESDRPVQLAKHALRVLVVQPQA